MWESTTRKTPRELDRSTSRSLATGPCSFDSGVLTNASPIVHINVSVAGVKELTLLGTNGVAGSIDYDHADWAGARLISTPAAPPVPVAPAAPSGLTATVASPTAINLSWTDNAVGNETGFIVERSVDGVNFAQVGLTTTGITAYTDTAGLSAGAAYSYRIAAINAVGNSGYSNIANAAIPQPTIASRFTLVGLPATSVAGTVKTFTLTVLDANGNVATGYTGVVHFTSSDTAGLLPPTIPSPPPMQVLTRSRPPLIQPAVAASPRPIP